ncbi:hypothetical protein dsx2_2642 [Desulfovibrio sp. X2]|uniref:hypothetical protein n=1 Tax=Desulfovibrio sp. X2 TaxID=941449 RepID=UPI0003589A55|nr:hypothetical protein [Desulfovibrio sp. X2]EPR42725.1 hypothetical protein dsx2_2642 [Desulfovibrio sp. X2]
MKMHTYHVQDDCTDSSGRLHLKGSKRELPEGIKVPPQFQRVGTRDLDPKSENEQAVSKKLDLRRQMADLGMTEDAMPDLATDVKTHERFLALAKMAAQSGNTPPRATEDDDRAALIEQARSLGMNPHPNTGVAKLKEMIASATPQNPAPSGQATE